MTAAHLSSPLPSALDAVGPVGRWAACFARRREVRALRAQERALGSLCGTELSDALAAARRA